MYNYTYVLCRVSDIDECALSTDDCEQICTNYDGGYECSCYSGYSLSQDLTACQGR